MSHRQQVLDKLEQLKLPFELYEHEAAHTMADCLKLPYATPDVTFCKNILLCNRQQTAYYLYVTLPDKPFRTADVSKLLGVSRLSFAPDEALRRLLDLESGSLTPLALWFAGDAPITLVLDKDIRREGRIAFHPCENTATVIFPQDVFHEQIVPLLSSSPRLLDVPWPQAMA